MDSTNPFEFQLMMLQKGAEDLPQKINHLNDIQLRVKIALTALWSVVIGWSVSADSIGISFIGYCIILGFLYPDLLVLKSQRFYLEKLSDIYDFFNNKADLEVCFKTHTIPQGLVYPLVSNSFELGSGLRKKLDPYRYTFRLILHPTIFLPYSFLVICNLVASLSLS